MERQLLIFGERSRGFVQLERERERRIDQRQHIGDCLADFAPLLPQLAPRDGGEFIEHLHMLVSKEAHRALASSRSKR